ncbi:MAG: GTP cyclohydrolase I [Acidobacteriota bacterium]
MPPRKPDRRLLHRAARLFLEGIGEPGLRRDQRRTPARVADAWSRELMSGYRSDPVRILGTSFASRETGMVAVHAIPFVSVCVHHLLPFHGVAHVAYIPDGRLVGLSKLGRAIDALSRRLQLQERLTRQIVEALNQALHPSGAACSLEAEHLCMTVRGARARGARVATTVYSGRFLDRPALRLEFQRLCGVAAPVRRAARRGRNAGGSARSRKRTARRPAGRRARVTTRRRSG